MDNFNRSLAFVLENEGGYSNHKNDRGGKTMLGITEGTLRAARKDGLTDCENVAELTRAEAEKIYRVRYWTASRADCMPWPLCALHFDAAVNHGVKGAGRLLQRALGGLKVDGIVGKLTLAELNKHDTKETCTKYLEQRKEKYRNIIAKDPTQKVFERGWTARLNRNAALVSSL